MHSFERFHPIVNFTWFVCVILFSMIFMNPVCLGISLAFSFLTALNMKGQPMLGFGLRVLLPVMVLTAVINPAFNHRGVTLIGYLPGGNPLTLESILFGLAASAMIGSVICWFACYNRIMTSDRFIYLFGRIIPSLSLIFSMILRFVPRFGAQLKRIHGARKALGGEEEGLKGRIRSGVGTFSAMIDWALESSIRTSDSMKSRGYGRRGRTAFSIYRFDRRDGALLVLILALSIYVLAGKLAGAADYRYFPDFQAAAGGPYTFTVFLAYGTLCAIPLLIELRERVQWNAFESNN
ncbi:MAG: energy-coupling factor transporter transmembrane protein EcfT [Firmicutes bacterium]|nr:energy-coupling factor transporter transmembrane protein EcfT [Bacillota bacterium]